MPTRKEINNRRANEIAEALSTQENRIALVNSMRNPMHPLSNYSLSTQEGRRTLGAAMVEPIRRALDYEGIGRRLLMVDELPEGTYARSTRQDVTVLPADDPSRLRLGWTIYEEVGITVINDYAVARIEEDMMGTQAQENIYETEEELLYNNLAEIKKDRQERELEELRRSVPNWSIMWLEV